MCFNAKTSLFTFIFSIITSILLVFYGNKKYKTENIVFGIFFIYIALMQLFDYLFWIDLDNKKNINHITTLIAPIINTSQPTFLYLLKLFFYPKIDYLFLFGNIFYFIYIYQRYQEFIKNDHNLKTTVYKNHLEWKWLNYFNGPIYLFFLIINTFYKSNFNYSLIVFLVTTFFLLLSYHFFHYHIGEIWCFFGAFIPIFILFFSYLI